MDIVLFCKQSQFHKLEIIDYQEEETKASVTFKAFISQGEKDATFCEKSHFEKVGERWYYKDGTIISS